LRDFDAALLGDRSQEFSAHLDRCEACRAKLDEHLRDQEAFSQGPEPARAARAIVVKRAARSPLARIRRSWLAIAASAMLPAAAALAFYLSGLGNEGGVREKGAVAIEVFVKGVDGQPVRLPPGRALEPGEEFQLAYRAAGRKQVTVFSVEKCRAELVYNGPAVDHGVVPHSFRLSGPEGDERLLVALSSGEISDGDIDRALAKNCDTRAIDTPAFSARAFAPRRGLK
jgi:hypothetical protein